MLQNDLFVNAINGEDDLIDFEWLTNGKDN